MMKDAFMDAIRTVMDFNSEFLSSALRDPEHAPRPTEEVRAACRTIAEAEAFPFDPEADDVTLLRQIAQFMDPRRL
ncbi:MAG: hypothetical protein IK095_01355 [Oscillospiraceae bacterium]|nr:hypothetical protein [Oscillospiraceae bacterium]